MPVRPYLWGLMTVLAATQAVPAEAQFRRSAPAQNRFRDFAPGPAMGGANAINPEAEKTKAAAQSAYRKHDYKRAIDLVQTVLAKTPEDAVGLHIRGAARINLGIRDKDIELVRKGIADSREAVTRAAKESEGSGAVYYIPYLHGMIALAEMEGRTEHAEVALEIGEQVLALPELKVNEKANLRFQRAKAYTILDKYEEAAGEYEKAIEVDNSHVGAYIALADAYAKAEKHDEAVKAYDTAADAFSNSTLIFNNRGTYLRSRGKLKEAVEDFGKAVEIDSQFVVGYINRGFTLMQLGEAARAEKDFDKVVELQPERKNVHELRGQARLAQGKLQSGIADMQKVTTSFPKYAKGHANLGFAQYFAGEFGAARKSFDTAVELDPSMKYLYTWRILSRLETGELEGLREQYVDTFAKPADKRDWVDNLVLYLADEVTAEELLAFVTTEDTARADQQNCEAYFVISRKLAKAGDAEGAKEHLVKTLECKASYLSAYRAAQFVSGKFDVAEKPTDAIVN